MIGTFIGQGVAIGIALVAEGPASAFVVWFVTMIIQQLEGNLLVPLIMGKVAEINPLAVTVTILMSAALFGLLGALVAVPAALMVQTLIQRVLAPAARNAGIRMESV
jgi:predicted PurR-regulated permease PerM